MQSKYVYILRMDGVERRGTVDELCPFTGLKKSTFYGIVGGHVKCPEGIYIGREMRKLKKVDNTYKKKDMWKEWDKTMAMFNNVKWVKSGGKSLSQ